MEFLQQLRKKYQIKRSKILYRNGIYNLKVFPDKVRRPIDFYLGEGNSIYLTRDRKLYPGRFFLSEQDFLPYLNKRIFIEQLFQTGWNIFIDSTPGGSIYFYDNLFSLNIFQCRIDLIGSNLSTDDQLQFYQWVENGKFLLRAHYALRHESFRKEYLIEESNCITNIDCVSENDSLMMAVKTIISLQNLLVYNHHI